MSNLAKCRIGNNCNFALTLKDSGVSVNWSTVTIRQIFMYSLAQKAWGGKCTYHVDASDGKKLKVTYPASQQMYTGDMRIVIQMAYQGHEATFDALAVNIVPLTGDVTGDSTIEAEDINLGIIVSDLSTSVITEILEACEVATKNANASKAACDTATANANTATSNANTATSNANTAANLANTKAALASQKAEAAERATSDAEQAITFAEEKGVYARTQGDYAKEQGDNAKVATQNASIATSNCNAMYEACESAKETALGAANNANNAASRTETAILNANTATTNANNAATNANNKVTELQGYNTRLQAVEGKTSKIAHEDDLTQILDNLFVVGVSEFDAQATFNDDAIVEGDIIGHGNTNVTGDVTCANGLVSLTEIAQKINNLVVIDNEEV